MQAPMVSSVADSDHASQPMNDVERKLTIAVITAAHTEVVVLPPMKRVRAQHAGLSEDHDAASAGRQRQTLCGPSN